MKKQLLTKAAAVALTAVLACSAFVCAVPAQAAETELPASLMQDFKKYALSFIEEPLDAPTHLPAYQEFVEIYDRVAEMMNKREITYDNYPEISAEMLSKLSVLMECAVEYGKEYQNHFGDINADGLVDINDATELQKVLAEAGNEDFFSRMCGNVNGDSNIDISDVTCIQKLVAEVIGDFPVYDNTFGIRDDYTADTDRETATAYLRDAVEARRAQREHYELQPASAESAYLKYLYFRMADRVLQDADSYSPAVLLYNARHLLATVNVW